MTLEHGLCGWTLCGVREKGKRAVPKRRPRRHRRHADLLLELTLMLVVAALLPRKGGRR